MCVVVGDRETARLNIFFGAMTAAACPTTSQRYAAIGIFVRESISTHIFNGSNISNFLVSHMTFDEWRLYVDPSS